MSIIITNKKTLKDTAIVSLRCETKNITTATKGDLTIIKSDDIVVGLNIINYEKYLTVKEGAHSLTNENINEISKLGFEIKDNDSNFIVGKIIEKTIHPRSDKLFVLKVMTDKELQIVTNSAVALPDMNVVVAKVGATMPNGMPIIFSKVMGVESEGMLCGEKSLGQGSKEGVLFVSQKEGTPYIL